MDSQSQAPKLSRARFDLVFNLYLASTFIGAKIGKLDLPVDDEGNIPSDIIGAICLMVRSAPGTEYWDPRNAASYRKMLEFLDPYLLPPYRPASSELPVALYAPNRDRIYL